MTKFRYIQKMHRELQRNAPDGWTVQTLREGRQLLTTIRCEDRDYFAPWLVSTIVEPFGFATVYA